MTDIDEGRLRAWLDGELARGDGLELEARLSQDPRILLAAEELREREARVRSLLSALDVDAPTERVRRALRAGREGSPRTSNVVAWKAPRGRSRSETRRPKAASLVPGVRLAQAAAMVLLLAGAAAAAVPGSPVRAWLSRVLDSGSEPPAAMDSAGPSAPEEGGLYVAPGRDRLEVDLVGVPPGAEILVTLIPGDTAVIYAPEGSEYEWDAEVGRARAAVSGGPIRLELPEGVDIDLIVDDKVYMSRRGGRIDLRVTPTFQSGSELRFRSDD